MKKLLPLLLAVLLLFAAAAADTVSIDLNQPEAMPGVTPENGGITITVPGTYILSGTLENGMIRVDTTEEGKVELCLNGVTIHHENGPAICCGKIKPGVTITLVAGSQNSLTDGETYTTNANGEPNGCIFSEGDLTIKGSGSLSVVSAGNDGIVSKDSLRVKDGVITVTAKRNGLRGRDSVEISGGTLTITCGKDGLRSNNEKRADRGFVSVTGGTVTITCGDDPIDAVTGIIINGGSVTASITKAD